MKTKSLIQFVGLFCMCAISTKAPIAYAGDFISGRDSMYLISSDGEVYRRADDGNWQKTEAALPDRVYAKGISTMASDGDDLLYTLGSDDKVYYQVNEHPQIEISNVQPPKGIAAGFRHSNSFATSRDGSILLGGDGKLYSRASSQGSKWAVASVQLPSGVSGRAFVLGEQGSSISVIGDDGKIYEKSLQGTSYSLSQFQLPAAVKPLASRQQRGSTFSYSKENGYFLIGDDGKIYHRGGGQQWSKEDQAQLPNGIKPISIMVKKLKNSTGIKGGVGSAAYREFEETVVYVIGDDGQIYARGINEKTFALSHIQLPSGVMPLGATNNGSGSTGRSSNVRTVP